MTGQLIDKTKERLYNVKNDAIGNMGIAPYQETEGEEYMNEKQLAHIEKILLAWRQSLMEE
ncbi:TPA: RNA polymerase-binding protein DksA, partial [Legionella pneumophila]|nr:RNA polymerase-binding protein DksA [Legionella pneumophila]